MKGKDGNVQCSPISANEYGIKLKNTIRIWNKNSSYTYYIHGLLICVENYASMCKDSVNVGDLFFYLLKLFYSLFYFYHTFFFFSP